jgi:hypothetical protein
MTEHVRGSEAQDMFMLVFDPFCRGLGEARPALNDPDLLLDLEPSDVLVAKDKKATIIIASHDASLGRVGVCLAFWMVTKLGGCASLRGDTRCAHPGPVGQKT